MTLPSLNPQASDTRPFDAKSRSPATRHRCYRKQGLQAPCLVCDIYVGSRDETLHRRLSRKCISDRDGAAVKVALLIPFAGGKTSHGLPHVRRARADEGRGGRSDG